MLKAWRARRVRELAGKPSGNPPDKVLYVNLELLLCYFDEHDGFPEDMKSSFMEVLPTIHSHFIRVPPQGMNSIALKWPDQKG